MKRPGMVWVLLIVVAFVFITEISNKSNTESIVEETNVTVEPFCGNGVCEGEEDVINCPYDCPLNFKSVGKTLREAWFAKFTFLFIIGAIIYLAYKEVGRNKIL